MDLTAKKRDKLPDSVFAGPNRTFPIENMDHARLAVSGAARALNAGNIDQDTHDEIVRKAHAYMRLHGAMSAMDKKPMGDMGSM